MTADIRTLKVTAGDIDFVLDTLYKKAKHDRTPVKALFYGMCSAFTKRGLSHNVNSPVAGAGKNYLLILVASLFPEKYIEQFVSVSNKAFLHKRGMMVIKNELTGELEPVGPMIDPLEKEISKLNDMISKEGNKQDSNNTKDKKRIRLRLKIKRTQSRKSKKRLKLFTNASKN